MYYVSDSSGDPVIPGPQGINSRAPGAYSRPLLLVVARARRDVTVMRNQTADDTATPFVASATRITSTTMLVTFACSI
jgi:hypothetical protein